MKDSILAIPGAGEDRVNRAQDQAPGSPRLADLIDARAVQSMLEDFHRLAGIPMGIIDLQGQLLVGVGWQDICLRFHRAHPQTSQFCIESDTQLSGGVPQGQCKLYRCKNHLWDVATPLMIAGRHVGNVFSGQFFFEDEQVDQALFLAQARKYGFPEKDYLAALQSVPRLSRERVETGMAFLTKLAQMLSHLGYSNMMLARSLSEREALMSSLHESQKDLNRAQAVAQTGSWRLDVRKDELLWSDETHRLFDIPRGKRLTYQSFLEAIHPEDRAEVDRRWAAALRGEPYDIEHRICVRGEVRWVRERGQLEFDDEGVLRGGFGTVQDVTERKLMELALRQKEALLRGQAARLEETVQQRTAKLQETISELEHYSYSITHDLRAPLRAMQGFATLLLEDCRNCVFAERLDLLRRIAASSTRMDQLIQDALDYSRVLRNELPLGEVDLARLLRGLVESYPDFQPPKARIELAASLPRVVGNEAAMTQCFSNLLGNAVKFVEPGVVPHIRVSCEGRGSVVRTWVADNGIGIPLESQERIFKMFQRVSTRYEGTGIGLALVHKVVQRMGGAVGVESEPGKGSRFWVDLRRADGVDSP